MAPADRAMAERGWTGDREGRVAAHQDRRPRATSSDRSEQPREDADRTLGCMCASRTKQRRDELPTRSIEHEQRMEHAVVIEAVEERELLVAVRQRALRGSAALPA